MNHDQKVMTDDDRAIHSLFIPLPPFPKLEASQQDRNSNPCEHGIGGYAVQATVGWIESKISNIWKHFKIPK
jgi:hypothetical protein